MSDIHPTAIIDESVEIGANVVLVPMPMSVALCVWQTMYGWNRMS